MPPGVRLARLRRAFWADGRGWILLSVSLGWLLTIGTRIVYPALVPAIREDFGFGYAATGVVIGLVWAAYGATQLPGGLLADVTSERAALVAGLWITAGGLLAVVLAPAYGAFLVATAIVGAGTGIYGPSRVTVLSNTFPDRDSTAIAASQAAGNVGNAVLPVIAGAVAGVLGWRAGLGYLAPPIALVAVGLYLVVPESESAAIGASDLYRETTRALARPSVYASTALLLCVMFVYQSLTGFLPTYLVDAGGLTNSTAATLYGVFFAVAVGMQFVAGVVADRFGVRRAIGAFALLSLPGFGLLVAGSGTWSLLSGVVLASGLLGCFPPAHANAVTVVPAEVQGTAYGSMRTVYIGLGAAGPVVTGWLAEAASLDVALVMLGTIVVGIVGVNHLLVRPG